MKHIKQDFSLKAWVPSPEVDLGDRTKAKIKLFWNTWYGHVAYQTKTDEVYSNMVANILPTDTPSTPGVGSKCHTIFFLKVVMLHITLKGNEH